MTDERYQLVDPTATRIFCQTCSLLLSWRWRVLSALFMCSMAQLSLNVSLLSLVRRVSSDARLPSRSTNVLDTIGIFKDMSRLLESLSSCLGEHEEDMNEHGDIENTEDNVTLPSNVLKRDRCEKTESSVESPVG